MIAVLLGCHMGLVAVSPVTEGKSGDSWGESGSVGTNNSAPPVEVDLTRRLYSIASDDIAIVEPSQMGAVKDQLFTSNLLIYGSDISGDRMQMVMALAGADGQQSRCEPVRSMPTADWSENPYFVVGPGRVETSFGGTPAAFYDFTLSGVFARDGSAWTDGALSMTLDGRELAASLGTNDICPLVESLGGACEACADGNVSCVNLRMTVTRAVEMRDATFDPRETGDCQ